MIYIIGSLSNPRVEEVAERLEAEGFKAFDQWRAAKGDFWADYALRKKLPMREALKLDFVETAFQFDLKYIKACTTAVLVMPAGRSGGIELGWVLGQGKPGYILYDGEPERPDLMAKMATDVFYNLDELVEGLKPKATKPTLRFNKETNSWEKIPNEFLRHGLGCSCEPCKKDPYITAEQERKERRDTSADIIPKELRQNYGLCTPCGKPTTSCDHPDCK